MKSHFSFRLICPGRSYGKIKLITINGKECGFKDGETILDAAEACGVRIPTLCYLKDTVPTGACRICLVELEGCDELVTSCNTPAVDGMKDLYTDSTKGY